MKTSELSYNKVGALKEIGAIEYRINATDTALSPTLKRAIIQRHVANLIDILPPIKFGGILERLATAYIKDIEIIAACCLLRSLIPLTYGCITAGTVIECDGYIGTKRKEGFDVPALGILPHRAADTRVILPV